jgi:deoxyribodipyrimidine photo-lyase
MSTTAIVWFRRDLRLTDNPALEQACRYYDRIVPVYVFDPQAEGCWAPGAAGRWWLHHSLEALAKELEGLGSRLILAQGDTAGELRRVRRVTGADAVLWNRIYEPAFVERDSKLKTRLRADGLTVHSCASSLLFEPWDLLKSDETPYLVFTPFWKQMQKRWSPPGAASRPGTLTPPARWPATVDLNDLELLPSQDWAKEFDGRWRPGETAAHARLNEFVDEAVGAYSTGRDQPGKHGTSRLSPHLHFGELSPGQVVRSLDAAGDLPTGQGKWAFLREIAWREFSAHLLFHHPTLPDRPLKHQFEAFPWRDPEDYAQDLKAWQQGRTGIPMVDAGMRELWRTGWMHNRVRMIVASFLIKNLLIPWQEGAKWFWDTLVDADLANNTAGWQWTAGCGADAAPYFRIFNPVLQGQKFDPNGDYAKRWCPEVSHRSKKDLHAPLEDEDQGSLAAIVDLKTSRQRALDAYEQIKQTSG